MKSFREIKKVTCGNCGELQQLEEYGDEFKNLMLADEDQGGQDQEHEVVEEEEVDRNT